ILVKVEISDLKFSYNSVPVLENLNFRIEAGEILAIVGPNASGKTTLLKCMNRTLKPNRGTVLIDDVRLDNLDKKDIAKKMGHVPQNEGKSFPTTVFDTVLMGRKPHGSWKPGERDLEAASEIICRLDLQDIAMRDVGEISGGQRQKVRIARALAQDPEVLLLDEPTSSLDLKHQLEVLNIVREQMEDGISTAMALHDLNLALKYSDKILMLKEGQIFAAGGKEVVTSRNIESVYGVSVAIEERAGQPLVIPEEPLTN
ncbi:MAG: ABC transporter ATP-binding protein, partial [Candidatus Bipolaricaulota bacterium]